MSIQYQLTPFDIEQMTPDLRPYTPGWPSWLYWRCLLPLVFLLLAVMASFSLAVVVCLLIAVGGQLTNHYSTKLTTAAFFTAETFAISTLPTTVTIDAEGLHFRSAARTSTYQWQYFQSLHQTKNYICLQSAPGERHLIPLRAFASDAESSAFLQAAQGYMTAAKQAPGPDHQGA